MSFLRLWPLLFLPGSLVAQAPEPGAPATLDIDSITPEEEQYATSFLGDVVSGGAGLLGVEEDAYLTFYLDNDLFGGTDENYTNGARLSWISKNRPLSDVPFIQRRLGDVLNGMGGSPWKFNYGFSLTQLIFTPSDPDPTALITDDRPYAGWLAVGFSVHAKTERVLNSLEVTLGTVGPNSFAENAQDLIHDVRDIPKFNGWDNQLRNEPTLNLHFRQTHRLPGREFGHFGLTWLGFWGADLGNVIVRGSVGSEVRFGYNLPSDFSADRLTVTAYTNQFFDEDGINYQNVSPWSVFLLGGFEGGAIAHNIFLDGNTFVDSFSIDKEPLVADIYAGFGIRYRDLRLSYVQTLRTKEFEGQDEEQIFGSLSLSLSF
ncbi:MAG: lipid A deacylase LpxR family protein [Verrucomicrobiota bacterium]